MKTRFVDYLRTDDEAGANISWGAVFAGVVTFVGIFITLSLIGSAIGFGTLQPTANDPINGAGTGVLIWTVINLLLSFAASGFMAGLTARRVGLVHGFLSWATTTILVVWLVSSTAISALSGVGSMLGSAANVAGKGVAAVAGGTADVVATGVEEVSKTVNLNVNTDQLQGDIKKFLRDTNEKELQPEYLQTQLDDSLNQIADAAKQVLVNPAQAEQVVTKVASDLKARAEKIGANVDRDAIAAAVSKNTELSPEEAKQATDNIYNGYQTAVEESKKAIDAAAVQMEKVVDQTKQTINDARGVAEDATNTAASASWWAFFGMLLSAIVASACGLAGNRVARQPAAHARV